MPIGKKVPKELALVYLYDPVPLSKFALDPIRSQTPFSVIVGSPDPELIGLYAPDRQVKVTIQPTRLEYKDESDVGFEARDISIFKALWNVLPPLSVKAFGVNVHMQLTVDGYSSGGEFVRDRFLAAATDLQKQLGKPIMSNATRIIYGGAEEYFDIRLTPLDIGTEWLHVQMHYHKAIHIADIEKLLSETEIAIGTTLEEWLRAEKIVWPH